MVRRRLAALFTALAILSALVLPALALPADIPDPISVTGVTLILPEDTSQEGGFQLGVQVQPETASNPQVSWSSSDETVATVSQEGYVTCVGPGTVTITVTTQEGGFTDTLTFTVKSALVPVASIALSPALAVLEQGSTAFLTVAIEPENASDQAVSWQSLDPAVATVSQIGQITGVAPGITQIIATTRDGNHTALCQVIVPPTGGEALTDIRLNQTDLTLTQGSTAFLRAETVPAAAELLWFSSQNEIVTVDQTGAITALAPGQSVITVLGVGGLRASCTVTVPDPQQETESPAEPVYVQDADTDALLPRTASYAGFSDVTEESWYYDAVKTAVELGIMNGYADGSFGPENEIRLCEAVKMAAVVHAAIYNEDERFAPFLSEPWYAPYVAYCIRVGILQADDFPDLERSATRAEMAYLFYGAVGDENLAVLNENVIVQDVALGLSQASAIQALYAAGVLTGDNAETRAFRPQDAISRAEAAAIIARVCLPGSRIIF